MDTLEKLYTVDDIARMTMLSTNVVRNYLKEGILKGEKSQGQWYFTEDDIKKLIDNRSVKMDINNSCKQDIMDFIDGVNTDVDGDIQICNIVDFYCKDVQKTENFTIR